MIGVDPQQVVQRLKSRTFNVSVIFPPTLVSEYQIRLAEWTPAIDLITPSHPFLTQQASKDVVDQFCPVYRLRAPEDPFGCETAAPATVASDQSPQRPFDLSPAIHAMMEQRGFVDEEVCINIFNRPF